MNGDVGVGKYCAETCGDWTVKTFTFVARVVQTDESGQTRIPLLDELEGLVYFESKAGFPWSVF